ncbi:MAG TPA: DUF4350 domain-containing protein [Candidatus Binatia bacterium]|nr:DUF4350 domain-containing protein [Candidatus Binatia bacterium]
MTPRTRNWLTAALATLLVVALAVTFGGLSGEPMGDLFQRRPSTFFTDSTGARALFLVTKKLLPAAEQWRRPLNLLSISADRNSGSTLIVAGPGKPISNTEAEHLDRWLAAGGQLILATGNGWPVSRAVREGNRTPADPPQDRAAEARATTYLSGHGAHLEWSKPGEAKNLRVTGASVPLGEITMQLSRSFSSVQGAQVIAAAGGAALAVTIPVGRGRIVAIADPGIVSNRALREADNAVWLVTLAAEWGSQKAFFDEYHHGFGQKRSASELTWAFLKTPWGWCAAQIAAAALLYVFGYRRRFGRISESPLPARTSALELVEARAGMFQAATAQGVAVELIAQNLCHEWSKICGKPVDLSSLSANARVTEAKDSAEQLVAFQALVSKTEEGEQLTDQEFIEVGRIARKLLQGPIA